MIREVETTQDSRAEEQGKALQGDAWSRYERCCAKLLKSMKAVERAESKMRAAFTRWSKLAEQKKRYEKLRNKLEAQLPTKRRKK